MNNRPAHNRWLVWLLLLIGILLQLMPWTSSIYGIEPNWLLLILVYWHIALPHRFGIGTAFIIGLILDLLSGSVLGIHTFAFSVVAYLSLFNFQLIRNLALWQQLIVIILLSICYEFCLFIIEILINHSIMISPISLVSCIVNGVLWPLNFLFMRMIRKRFWIS
ncbi:rod shape-determining protein MreD [Utexia brackfieldae]|uniref:rod shape-determining protein MreD n=1 Tax=Utexia brackfieldae TaxID=3074108 RepID=UPI00370D5129